MKNKMVKHKCPECGNENLIIECLDGNGEIVKYICFNCLYEW